MKSLFDTLNIVHGEDEKRGFVKLNAISLGFTIGGVVFLLAALGSIVVVHVILNYIGLSNAGDILLRIDRWPAMYLVLTLALAVIYRYGPNRKRARWRWITWGSAIAALLWLAASGLFSWYAANRQVQRNLRLARRGHRIYDVALDLCYHRPALR